MFLTLLLLVILTDLSKENLSNVQMLKSFQMNESLQICVNSTVNSVDYTYLSQINCSRSLIDHFFVSYNLFSQLRSYSVLHEGDNLSDHSAVCMKISLSQLNYPYLNSDDRSKSHSISWEKASDYDICMYQNKAKLLNSMYIPWEAFNCKNCSCKDCILSFYNEFINVHIKACINITPVEASVKKEDYFRVK